MARNQAKIRANIKVHGWHVILVPEDDEGPGFAYSIGLEPTFDHPEIIAFGLPIDTLHAIVNNVGEEVRRGVRFVEGDSSTEILEGEPVVFRGVSPSYHDEYLGQAVGYHGDGGFRALHCFWCDANDRFPWQPGCQAGVVRAQPLLQGEPSDPVR